MSGEITISDNTSNRRKKKGLPGFVKFLIALLIIILVIPLILAIVAFILFFDAGHKDVEVSEDFPTEEVFRRVVVDSLDETPTTKLMSLAVTEDNLNQLLYNAMEGQPELKDVVKNFYVEANDGKYDFTIEVNAANFFKTRAILQSHLDVTEEAIIFNVDNIQVGKVGNFNKLTPLLAKFVDSNSITEALQSSGLNLKFSLEDLTITYATEDFYHDLANILTLPENYSAIFNEVISNTEIRHIGASGKKMFAVDIDIEKLQVTSNTHGIENYSVKPGYFNGIINNLKGDMTSLLNNQLIKEEDVDVVCKYFLGGETILNSGEQSIVNGYKTADAFNGYPAATTPYYDYTTNVANELRTKMMNQLLPQAPQIALGQPINAQLTAEDFDLMFSSSSAFGNINNFVANTGTNDVRNYKDNYIMLDRASTLMKDGGLLFVINMNFNGVSGNVTLMCDRKALTTDNYAKMKFDISKVYLGDIEVSSNTKQAFLDTVSGALNNDAFSSVFSLSGNEITFDLSQVLQECGITPAMGYDFTFNFVDTTSLVDGVLQITGTHA